MVILSRKMPVIKVIIFIFRLHYTLLFKASKFGIVIQFCNIIYGYFNKKVETVLVFLTDGNKNSPESLFLGGRYGVVTGANRGVGFGIAKLLASNGIVVVLTARDEKRGLEAVEKLKKDSNLTQNLIFHQLDVTDPASIACLVEFITSNFGKLDILVNNAGVGGTAIDSEKLAASTISGTEEDLEKVWRKVLIQTYDLAKECIDINYYGSKRTIEALIPLLQLSDSPRIVNVSSSMGILQFIKNEWANRVLSDVDSLSEEKIDEILSVFLRDFSEDSLESRGWLPYLSAYAISKAAMNAHTRILARKNPNFCVNSVCPGSVKTDMTNFKGMFSIEEAAEYVVKFALLPNGGPSGQYFLLDQSSSF